MVCIHAIAAGHPECAMYAVLLLVGALPEELLSIRMRGFGRGRGSFRLLRVLFVLLFTTVLGPIVLVAVIVFVAYGFFTSRRGR
jgi:transketolase N-terminal domain/subunit